MIEIKIEIYNDFNKKNVNELILKIQNEEFRIPITPEQQPDLGDIPGFYQVNNGNFWVAKVGDAVVGTIALLDIGNNKGALRKMFVAKEYRGKDFGVGQALLNHLLEWAKQKAFGEILLGTTAKFTRAHRFYEKNGFVVMQKEELPVKFPRMDVDVKFYRFLVHSQ